MIFDIDVYFLLIFQRQLSQNGMDIDVLMSLEYSLTLLVAPFELELVSFAEDRLKKVKKT